MNNIIEELGMDTRRLTEKAQEALQGAMTLAEREHHAQVEPLHLLVALLDRILRRWSRCPLQ